MSIIDRVKNIKDRRVPRKLQVKSATNVTPNMRRVTLQGDVLQTFPKGSEGAYIKMLFKQAGQEKPTMRTYTVAQQRSEPNEIDVDFMLHNSESNDHSVEAIAAPWSLNTQIGDEISLMGPGPAKFIQLDADRFLLAADMTALPALAANLKTLADDAHGKVFIEILSEDDKQDLQKPTNIELIWVINNAPGSDASPLFHAIEQAEWLAGKVAVWVACEFKTMKKIRQYLKIDRGVEKSHLYVSSYWKKGNTEEEHKAVKQADESNR
ncbi:MAG: NADPH-dependent ferric siderophore reductase [Cocleimonas sp.]|jgi:NADPH-dependent ferric siderophore reductase